MKLLIILFFLMTAYQHRQVILFYNDQGKTLFDEQMTEIRKHNPGFAERDIQVKSYRYGPETASNWKKNKIDPDSAFTFILIGRDGGEKYRSVELVKAATLFGQIDAMPMRQNEVRRKN